MPHVAIAGNEIYYEIHGAGEPLLLIPGIGLDSRYWLYQLPYFARHFQVITFDPRDTGQTKSGENAYTINDLADDAIALLDTLGVSYAHVLGYSMGALVAQALAGKKAELVTSLILVSVGRARSHKNKSIIANWLELTKRLPVEIALTEIMLWVHGDHFLESETALDTRMKEILGAPYAQSLAQYERQVKALLNPDLLIDLTAINAPTLVVCGTQDRIFSASEMQHIAHNISSGSIQYIEAGHELLQESPEQANEMIVDFCLSHSAKAIK
jgi:pimeloyl-ACP methyl ester carboxylesterase